MAPTEEISDAGTDAATDAGTGTTPDAATRLVLSYPADLSDWGRSQVETPWFRAYLRKARERVAEGEVLEEFVGVGCCGGALDVPLRVESIDGERVTADTEIVYEVRGACGIQGNWRVQSAGGPAN